MPSSSSAPPSTKGERTANRILDAAQALFADRGYDGTTLRQIAAAAGLREPGLYNHFASKQDLYEAVLSRAISPLIEAVALKLDQAVGLRDYTDLPGAMTDRLLASPQTARLLQQALQSAPGSLGNRLVHGWLNSLFEQGMRGVADLGVNTVDRESVALNVIAILNLVTGYFLANPVLATLADRDIHDPDTVVQQKRLLHRVIRAMLIS